MLVPLVCARQHRKGHFHLRSRQQAFAAHVMCCLQTVPFRCCCQLAVHTRHDVGGDIQRGTLQLRGHCSDRRHTTQCRHTPHSADTPHSAYYALWIASIINCNGPTPPSSTVPPPSQDLLAVGGARRVHAPISATGTPAMMAAQACIAQSRSMNVEQRPTVHAEQQPLSRSTHICEDSHT